MYRSRLETQACIILSSVILSTWDSSNSRRTTKI